MNAELLQEVLGWCIVINGGLLLLWALFFLGARDFMYRLHSRWFRLPEERIDAIHYCLIGVYKLMIIVFLVSPYVALRIVGG